MTCSVGCNLHAQNLEPPMPGLPSGSLIIHVCCQVCSTNRTDFPQFLHLLLTMPASPSLCPEGRGGRTSAPPEARPLLDLPGGSPSRAQPDPRATLRAGLTGRGEVAGSGAQRRRGTRQRPFSAPKALLLASWPKATQSRFYGAGRRPAPSSSPRCPRHQKTATRCPKHPPPEPSVAAQ